MIETPPHVSTPSKTGVGSAAMADKPVCTLRSVNISRAMVSVSMLVVLCLPSAGMAQGTQRAASEAVAVRYAQAKRAVVQDRLKAMGTVVASRSTVVASEVAGSVKSFSVRPGERVRRGQELARLRAKPLELRLAAAQGELEEAQARLRSSKLRLERLQSLADSEVVSTQNVDDALYELQAWEGRAARLSAEVDRLRDEVEHAVLRAPFDGAVIQERTQIGQWLRVGDPVVEMVSLSGLEARLDIPESRFGHIVPGVTVRVTVEDSGLPPVNGKVRAVVPKAAELAHTFPAYVSLPDNSDLAIGMLVEGEIELGSGRDAVWVPKEALVKSGDGDAVFIVTADSTVRRVSVQLGRAQGLWQEVTPQPGLGEQVQAGDRVVTHGNESLEDGRRVRAVRQEYPGR